jgi:hypothetical protein
VPVYRPNLVNITLTTATPAMVTLPRGSKEHIFAMGTDVAFQVAFSEAALNADEGIPVASGAQFTIDGPVETCEVWFKQSSGGDIDLRWAYLYPRNR